MNTSRDTRGEFFSRYVRRLIVAHLSTFTCFPSISIHDRVYRYMKDSDEKIHTATRKLCISKQDLLYGFQTNMLNLAPISCSFIIKLPSQASTGLQAARQKLLRARLLNSPKVVHSSLPNSASITVNIQSTRTEVRCWFWPVW